MSDLLPFCSDPICCKCTNKNIKTKYKPATKGAFLDKEWDFGERLERTCAECGYNWLEEVYNK